MHDALGNPAQIIKCPVCGSWLSVPEDGLTEKNKTKLMDLTYDFMFKAVFGNATNMKALTLLISNYFKIDFNEIEGKVRIMNSELLKNDKKDKKKCVDIIVEINDNEILNIEMNANRGNEWSTTIERNTAYICKIFSEQYRSVFK